MKITFFGAARAVTGSKHLIETEGFRLLLDCGLHQGKRSEANALNKTLPFDAASVDAVILSHAHADHCGMLPVLVRQGFKGKVYCTAATADIAKLILEDSAILQEQDAEYYNAHRDPHDAPIAPLYTKEDAKAVFNRFEPVPYFRQSGQWTSLGPRVRFKFYDAGHILGSAVTLLEIKENGAMKRLAFTGDLGRKFLPILHEPEYIGESAQTLLMECTYGSRLHKPLADLEAELKKIVGDAVAAKSKILVPAFSLGRTQELIYMLHKLIDKGEIPAFPMYVDSPLAEKITKVFERYVGDFNEQFWQDFGERGDDPFLFKGLTAVKSVEESKAINAKSGPLLVIAGSGMCEGGRILHHLKNSIGDPNTIVLITGYQAEHTLGRRLLEGINPVRIFGQEHRVRARVLALNELSAHADQKGLLGYAGHAQGLQNLFLVHTEMKEASAFRQLVEKTYPKISLHIPEPSRHFEL